MQDWRVFADPYNDEIYEELADRREFYLWPPPPGLIIWQDNYFMLIELPIPVTRDAP